MGQLTKYRELLFNMNLNYILQPRIFCWREDFGGLRDNNRLDDTQDKPAVIQKVNKQGHYVHSLAFRRVVPRLAPRWAYTQAQPGVWSHARED